MKRLNEAGMSALIIPLILTVLLLLGALGWGFMNYQSMQKYKTQSDQISAVAVKKAETALAAKLQVQFGEQEKQPLRTYQSPPEVGSVSISYPKTWSAYIDDRQAGGTPLNAYFHPLYVPSVNGPTAFALRVQVLERAYDLEIKALDNLVKQGKTTATPYRAPQMPNVLGIRFDGALDAKKSGSVVYFKVRDKTLRIATESTNFTTDLNNSVLQNLTFSP